MVLGEDAHYSEVTVSIHYPQMTQMTPHQITPLAPVAMPAGFQPPLHTHRGLVGIYLLLLTYLHLNTILQPR